MTCLRCNGTGRICLEWRDADRSKRSTQVLCPYCDGSGKVECAPCGRICAAKKEDEDDMDDLTALKLQDQNQAEEWDELYGRTAGRYEKLLTWTAAIAIGLVGDWLIFLALRGLWRAL